MPRLFFAIQTPPAIRAVLEDAQKELAKLFDRDALRLEHLENSHVTLAFLGEIAEASWSPSVSGSFVWSKTYHGGKIKLW